MFHSSFVADAPLLFFDPPFDAPLLFNVAHFNAARFNAEQSIDSESPLGSLNVRLKSQRLSSLRVRLTPLNRCLIRFSSRRSI